MPNIKGPMFNGQAARAVDDAVAQITREIATQGQHDVQERLGHVLRHPTGKYQHRIRVAKTSKTVATVDDQRSVYGPWLEGTSRRNTSTRFKGYSTFRKVMQALDRKAPAIANRVIARYLGRM